MGFAPTTSTDKDTGKKVYTFSLRLPELLGLTTIILVGFIWVFIFGLLVGRGYQPEEALPELKHIMPDSNAVATAEPLHKVKPAAAPITPVANGKSEATLEHTTQQPAKPKQAVLKPEQLNFFEQLKAKENGEQVAATKSTSNKVVTRPSQKAASKPAQKTMPVATNSTSKATQKKATTSLDRETATFEYIYQVAASTDKSAAVKLRKALSSKGFTATLATAVIKTTTWYRINVHFVGSDKALSNFKQRLASAGHNKPLLKKKKQQ